MNGQQAKKMRRIIYGDHSIRLREFITHTFKHIIKQAITPDGIVIEFYPKTVMATGFRRDYQNLKKAYKRARRTNE